MTAATAATVLATTGAPSCSFSFSDYSGESNKLNDLNQAVVDRVSGSEDKLAS